MKVTGEGRMKESITRKRRAASVANVGSQCDLSLKIPGMTMKWPSCSREGITVITMLLFICMLIAVSLLDEIELY